VAEIPASPTVEPRLRGGSQEGSSPAQYETRLPSLEGAPATLTGKACSRFPTSSVRAPSPAALIQLLESLRQRQVTGDWPVACSDNSRSCMPRSSLEIRRQVRRWMNCSV